MNNYFSIGVDAKIALQFHETRNENPHMFSNQMVNKMWYAKFGTDNMMGGCPGLGCHVNLVVSDQLSLLYSHFRLGRWNPHRLISSGRPRSDLPR